MSKDAFNDKSRPQLNEYALTLTAHAGVFPLRGSRGRDKTPAYQAQLFRDRVGDWLEANHEYENHNVLTTEVLSASKDGLPRMKIVCTADALERVKAQFGSSITNVATVKEDVSSKRIIKRPDMRRKP